MTTGFLPHVLFLCAHLAVPESTDGLPWRERRGETAFVSEGDLFQEEGCPYVLSRKQAEQVMNDDSEVGNTVTLVTHGGGELDGWVSPCPPFVQ